MAENLITTTIRVDGDTELLLAFDRISHWPSRGGKDLVDFLANNALFWTRIYAPVGETGELLRHVSRTQSRWRPGGAGGGGAWEATAGVQRIPSARAGSEIYPAWVHGGTGKRTGGWIYAKGRGGHGVMVIDKKDDDKPSFRHRVSGQQANPFVFKAFQRTSIYARARLHTLGREIVRSL